ncbi:response regulator transcription factor [Pelagicoccus mobilis]|uniref:Response regulator transcription factor n=1 Tax=Pelagicoccus mobilis TaxID=415221 RepID=A0A934RZL5_9BACT|nr:response regulator transcription factor [Pelagicoccus mobilis]MBK1877801.1 response regulator transcription factor [Pelagicoccus mobilis]
MTTPYPIRLMLVDDHTVVRMGLAAILQLHADIEVVAEAEDGAQALLEYRKAKPDVVLMDVSMPVTSGIEAIQNIVAETPDAKILLLTMSDLDEDIQGAFEAGARGYILKNASHEEIVEAVRIANKGDRYITDSLQNRLNALAQIKHISERELEVLEGMRRGLTNRDISLTLDISEHTVKAHVKAILKKLESADRAEAVARGFEKGLLRLNDSQT